MKLGNEQTELERKLEKAKEGYASLSEGMLPFGFAEQTLGRDEVTTRFQQGLNLFAEVRRTQEEQQLAMEKLQQALPWMKQFHGEAMQVARKQFGADAKAMATFGVKCPERGERRRSACWSGRCSEVITEVVQEVIVEEEVVRCKEPAPKRGCRSSRLPERPAKRGCEPAKQPKRPVKHGCDEAKGCGSRLVVRPRRLDL